ncbi:MAG TPA: carboxypeptidase-like regulatory domain-containing protein [Candidatus Acidoferrales bacterium]
MRRMIRTWMALILALSFATIAAAQGTGRVSGEILDREGKPYPDVNVEIKNPDTGQAYTTKTDKAGRFTQLGLLSGVYIFTLTNEKDHLDFKVQFRVVQDQENLFKLNFKEVAAQQGPSAEEVKKREEDENKFKNMKTHFDAGMAAINDSAPLRAQLKTAPADQQSGIKDKLNTDYQTAITELKMAEQGVLPKDTKTHAIVWSNLGQAYEFAGRYDEAAAAFTKAAEMQPQASYYDHLSINLTNAAAAQPTLDKAKLADAGAACDKAAAADPAVAARCWKNMGIVLSNKNHQPDAVAPLQKATQLDPKDAQAWFLLGGALSAQITPKQEGDKMTYQIPPGTAEAYQKCIDLAPTGPYAEQAKQMLDGLAAMGGGDVTSLSTKKAKKKS